MIVAIAVVGSALYPDRRSARPPARDSGLHRHPRLRRIDGRQSLLGILGALLVGAIFAKVVSTANNYLFSPATNLVNDVFVRYIKPDAGNKQVLLGFAPHGRGAGRRGRCASRWHYSVLKKSLYAYTIYAAALTPVILAAFFWRRATAAGAVASIAAGTVVTVAGILLDTASARSSATATPSSPPCWPRCSACSSSAWPRRLRLRPNCARLKPDVAAL